MPRAAKQQYRIYIHGHSYRHVFGTHDAKEVTAWMVKLYKGQQPGFPRCGPYDWTVEKLTDEYGWTAIDALSKQALIAAIHHQVKS